VGELVLGARARGAGGRAPAGDPVRKPNNTLKGFARLPLRVTPGRA
jgi:hypothetical protein